MTIRLQTARELPLIFLFTILGTGSFLLLEADIISPLSLLFLVSTWIFPTTLIARDYADAFYLYTWAYQGHLRLTTSRHPLLLTFFQSLKMLYTHWTFHACIICQKKLFLSGWTLPYSKRPCRTCAWSTLLWNLFWSFKLFIFYCISLFLFCHIPVLISCHMHSQYHIGLCCKFKLWTNSLQVLCSIRLPKLSTNGIYFPLPPTALAVVFSNQLPENIQRLLESSVKLYSTML